MRPSGGRIGFRNQKREKSVDRRQKTEDPHPNPLPEYREREQEEHRERE